jgi:hypothetical protein
MIDADSTDLSCEAECPPAGDAVLLLKMQDHVLGPFFSCVELAD